MLHLVAPMEVTKVMMQAVAGIIGAVNNTTGVVGVAPNCKIIPIRINYITNNDPYGNWSQNGNGICVDDWMADGIRKAWSVYGADILNFSWNFPYFTLGNQQYNPPPTAITNAINEAATQRRGGKGCIIINSTGNGGFADIAYPSYLANVVAVGAITPCGKLKIKNGPCAKGTSADWGSNYHHYGVSGGGGYDYNVNFVAPGVAVATTDLTGSAGYNNGSTDYTFFSGTSAATPFASGVAALVLSVNPNLSRNNVRAIMEKSAQKLSGYTFSNNGSRSGTFHQEVGCGLINADSSVKEAKKTLIKAMYEAEEVEEASSTKLYSNNPNPFSQSTEIGFYISEAVAQATLLFYNLLGEKIMEIDVSERGYSSFMVSADEFKPGMYIYTLFLSMDK